MRATDLVAFLWGSRAAIERIAADPWAITVAGLLVMSAALARDYDGLDLSRRGYELLAPMGVSLVTSFILFNVVWSAFGRRVESRPGYWSAYRQFLALFWMTAPLAWLYGIPYERFMSEYGATLANMWTLALVSAWRVALMVRVVSVLFDQAAWRAFGVVMVVADVIAVAMAFAAPKPVIAIMGGIRHSATDRLILDVMYGVMFIGVASLLVWVPFAGVAALGRSGKWGGANRYSAGLPRASLVFASAAVVLWIGAAIAVQSEQRLAGRVERLWVSDRPAAVGVIASYERSDFPPHWAPALPKFTRWEDPEDLVELELLTDRRTPPWLRDVATQNLLDRVPNEQWYALSPRVVRHLAEVLPSVDAGPQIADALWASLVDYRPHGEDAEEDDAPTQAALARIRELALEAE